MRVINKSKYDLIFSNVKKADIVYGKSVEYIRIDPPFNIYQKINEKLFLFGKIEGKGMELVMRDSFILNEIEIEKVE